MKILFLCFSGLKFTVNTPRYFPLGGTESAVSYLAIALAARGHDVTVMGHIPEGSDEIIEGVRHLELTDDQAVLDKLDPDVVIAPSAPSAFPGIKKMLPRAKLILWNHMRPDQPAIQSLGDPKIFEAIYHIVYVSEVQKKAFAKAPWLPIPGTPHQVEEVVINNAIAPVFEGMFTGAGQIQAEKKCRGAYTSTPFRGLAALTKVKELPIEVYSSMKVYQSSDEPFAQMYENLLKNDCIEMKGSVSQKDLAQRLRPLAFYVYPSIFPECHSIAILEAMASGMKIITTDCATEPNEFVDIMPMRGTIDDFAKLLRRNINSFRSRPEAWAEKMWEQVQYINREFTWKKKAGEWEDYLTGVLKTQQPA